MKKNKSKKLGQKRVLFIIGALVLAAGAIGLTLAISGDRSILNNEFGMATYSTTATDTFTSPSNWQTCQTAPKTITVTNNSDKAVAVRIKLEEDWIASDGTTHLPLVSAASGLTMAQIEFTPNSGWSQDGAYYVYDTDLAANATTSSLITGVTLNCDANLDTTADSTLVSDGVYADATYHLKATIETAQADKADEIWDQRFLTIIAKQVNEPYNIDFTKKAIVSSDPATANGNGVNKYTENGTDIYYFRGQVDNNNVIWADICWKIVRTTATGGVKMIYNGEPTTVGTAKQCDATGAATDIGLRTFNDRFYSPADAGYKYGTRITSSYLSAGSTVFIFSNDVSKNGSTYTLDTSTGQSISGTWEDERLNAAVRYHYFCTDGAASCDNTKIGYIYEYNESSTIYYLPVNGYADIEAMKDAMFMNTRNSDAKTTIESWFETKNLNGHVSGSRNYEDDLEDAIFCNDRSFYSGALKGKDSDATPSGDTQYNYFSAYGRNRVKTNNNYTPSLDCTNSRDAFQVSNNDAKLNHKVGLITADELTLAGTYGTTAYLYTGREAWSASPSRFYTQNAYMFYWKTALSEPHGVFGAQFLRPMVSLKSGTEFTSGSGLTTDPYIVP